MLMRLYTSFVRPVIQVVSEYSLITLNIFFKYWYNNNVYHKQVTFKNDILKRYNLQLTNTKKNKWFKEIHLESLHHQPVYIVKYTRQDDCKKIKLKFNGEILLHCYSSSDDETDVFEARLCGTKNSSLYKKFSYGINITEIIQLIIGTDSIEDGKHKINLYILPFLLLSLGMYEHYSNCYISIVSNESMNVHYVNFIQ